MCSSQFSTDHELLGEVLEMRSVFLCATDWVSLNLLIHYMPRCEHRMGMYCTVPANKR
jgi:hypothetical protein